MDDTRLQGLSTLIIYLFATNFDALFGVNCNFNKVSYLRYWENFQWIEIELDGIDNDGNSTLALEPPVENVELQLQLNPLDSIDILKNLGFGGKIAQVTQEYSVSQDIIEFKEYKLEKMQSNVQFSDDIYKNIAHWLQTITKHHNNHQVQNKRIKGKRLRFYIIIS